MKAFSDGPFRQVDETDNAVRFTYTLRHGCFVAFALVFAVAGVWGAIQMFPMWNPAPDWFSRRIQYMMFVTSCAVIFCPLFVLYAKEVYELSAVGYSESYVCLFLFKYELTPIERIVCFEKTTELNEERNTVFRVVLVTETGRRNVFRVLHEEAEAEIVIALLNKRLAAWKDKSSGRSPDFFRFLPQNTKPC